VPVRSPLFRLMRLQLFALFCGAMALTPRYFGAQVAMLMQAGSAPTLGNYPDTSLSLSTDTTLTPDATPTNTTRINVPPQLTSRASWKVILRRA